MVKQNQKVVACAGLDRCEEDFKCATTLKFIFGKYGPDWYQAMTSSQMAAANSLHEGVVEDLEQGTVRHCDKCLRGIGIKPVQSNSKLLLAVKQSRGNDLAFLWFVLQMFYSSDRQKGEKITYSLNECLIMSAIAHLDMISTLRQLDKQLPKPHPTSKPPKVKIQVPMKIKYSSPYLQPLPIPKVPPSHQLPRPILPAVNFAPYNEFDDPMFSVLNEESRWYDKSKPLPNVNRGALLKELFKQNSGKERYAVLLEQFTDSVRCKCSEGHVLNSKTAGIVHKIDLDKAPTKKIFERLALRYQTQLLVRELTQQLIFATNTGLDNISVCINCPKCQRDFELLKTLMKYNEGCPHPNISHVYSVDYDSIIGSFIFGTGDRKAGAVKLLKNFNEMSVSTPINVCVKDLWHLELTLWTDQVNLSSLPVCTIAKRPNPRNDAQMDAMLTEALRDMSVNPKFVLASLPNVNQLPILREWIRVRYGLKYSRAARQRAVQRTLEQWTRLNKEKLHVHVPSVSDVRGTGKTLNYGHKNAVMICINKMNRNYHHRLAVTLVNDARRFWPTMTPYHCVNGAPTDVFYAYLPATEYAVMSYRPWAIHEFRDQVKI